MRRAAVVAAILAASVCSCIETATERRLIGAYSLLQSEQDGRLYLERTADTLRPVGGVLEGWIEKVGWDDRLIVARRMPVYGSARSGWMIVNVSTHAIEGPMSDAEFEARREASAELRRLEIRDAPAAWATLR